MANNSFSSIPVPADDGPGPVCRVGFTERPPFPLGGAAVAPDGILEPSASAVSANTDAPVDVAEPTASGEVASWPGPVRDKADVCCNSAMENIEAPHHHRSGVHQVVSVHDGGRGSCGPVCSPVVVDGKRDHGCCDDRSLTNDSVLREVEACCRWERDALESGLVALTQQITTGFSAAALAASTTDKLILQGQTQLAAQAASNFAAMQLQAAQNSAAALMATEKAKCDIEKAIAECCCETKALIIAEADRTRQQANEFRIRDLERAVDRLTPPPVTTAGVR